MRATLTICISIILAVALLPTSSLAPGEPEAEPYIPPPAQEKIQEPAPLPYPARPWKPIDAEPYKAELKSIAEAKGLPAGKVAEIEGVIGGDGKNKLCPNGESGWNTKAVGDKGTSFGLVQIHLPAHPHVTRAQAEDPTFALNFIVDEFLKGNEWKWTCWKAMYGTTPPLPHSEEAGV